MANEIDYKEMDEEMYHAFHRLAEIGRRITFMRERMYMPGIVLSSDTLEKLVMLAGNAINLNKPKP